MIQFQTRFGNQNGNASEMLRRLFAHNLFLNTQANQIQSSTGKSHAWDRRWIWLSHKAAPWLLFISLGILVSTFGWISLLFLPIFLVGYFLFSLQSVRNGSIVLPSAILVTANALPWIPEVQAGLGVFLAFLSGALWCNRFTWWYADFCLSRNPALGQLFRQPESSRNTIAEAEVIEVTDIPASNR